MTWEPSKFLIAQPSGPTEKDGYVFRGLGMHQTRPASPKGRRGPEWNLTHIGTGHLVAKITGHVSSAMFIASEIADLTDWDFDGLDGWKNRDPQLAEKIVAYAAEHPKLVKLFSGRRAESDGVARAIALSRN